VGKLELDIDPPEKRWGVESIWILRFHAKKAAENLNEKLIT
jgi:hypothetical protein